MTEVDDRHTRALELYAKLLDAWNRRCAEDFAKLFGESGSCVGFDGSQMNGQSEIESSLSPIFENHPTASYVVKVRGIRSLDDKVTLVRAVAGMIPPGTNEINPETNAIQTLVVTFEGLHPQIAMFQNTPAAFHGRPELSESLTKELLEVARAGVVLNLG